MACHLVGTNAGILLIGPLGTNFSEILIGIQAFSFKKMHVKMSSAKWRPFCLGLNVLNQFLEALSETLLAWSKELQTLLLYNFMWKHVCDYTSIKTRLYFIPNNSSYKQPEITFLLSPIPLFRPITHLLTLARKGFLTILNSLILFLACYSCGWILVVIIPMKEIYLESTFIIFM